MTNNIITPTDDQRRDGYRQVVSVAVRRFVFEDFKTCDHITIDELLGRKEDHIILSDAPQEHLCVDCSSAALARREAKNGPASGCGACNRPEALYGVVVTLPMDGNGDDPEGPHLFIYTPLCAGCQAVLQPDPTQRPSIESQLLTEFEKQFQTGGTEK